MRWRRAASRRYINTLPATSPDAEAQNPRMAHNKRNVYFSPVANHPPQLFLQHVATQSTSSQTWLPRRHTLLAAHRIAGADELRVVKLYDAAAVAVRVAVPEKGTVRDLPTCIVRVCRRVCEGRQRLQEAAAAPVAR